MEAYKIVAKLVSIYDFELADPSGDWTVHDSMFPR